MPLLMSQNVGRMERGGMLRNSTSIYLGILEKASWWVGVWSMSNANGTWIEKSYYSDQFNMQGTYKITW